MQYTHLKNLPLLRRFCNAISPSFLSPWEPLPSKVIISVVSYNTSIFLNYYFKKNLINGKKKITTNLRIYHDNYILYYIRNYKFDINFSQVIDNSYFLIFFLYIQILNIVLKSVKYIIQWYENCHLRFLSTI